jgi:hypothetical protein
MTDQTQPATDFQAAAAVEAAIKDLPKLKQELVLRWVAESLGIVSAPAPGTTPAVTPIVTPPIVTAPPGAPSHQMDIATFVAFKQPKTDIQFVTVVAYYHRFVAPEGQRLATITPQLAQDATRLADWDRLTAPGSTLNNAKNQGYLDSAGPGEFSLNTVGENLVARTLPPKEGSKKSGKKGDKRKKTAKKKTTTKKKTTVKKK